MEGDPLKDQATRVAKLWSQLDVDNRGALDKNALKKGYVQSITRKTSQPGFSIPKLTGSGPQAQED